MTRRVYHTCRECRTPDESARYFEDTMTVLCPECHMDVRARAESWTGPDDPDDTIVRLSPAAQAALATIH